MKALIWLAFDMGVRGDFEGMYEFLDAHGAKECGDSLSVLSFEYRKDLVVELTKELRAAVNFDKRSRVYVIYPSSATAAVAQTVQGKTSGKFIIGKRRAPAWAGFGPSQGDEEDIGE